MIIKAGSTNVSVYFYVVQDASATSPGEPVTGLLFSDIETGGSASYVRQGAARVDLTLITLASASATHADGGFILVDDTNMPGLYRCDYADATFATGVDQVFLQIDIATGKNAIAAPILVDIDDNVDQTADHTAGIADIPTVSEFNARTLVAASYFDPAADAVANVTLTATTTTVTGGATSAAQTTAQNDLDIITGASGVNLLTATQTSIDAIEADTTEIGTAGAGLTNINLPNQTMDIIGTISTVTTVTNQVTADMTAVNGVTLGTGAVPELGIVDSGTAQSATATTVVLRSAAAFADDELIGAVIVITGGTTGVGQSAVITDYVLSTDTATVDTWTTTPTGTIKYVVFASPQASAALPTPSNVVQVSGDTTAADNLELMYDGSGYIADSAPASRSQVENVSSVGAAVHVSAISSPGGFVITTGTEDANNEDSTVALDGIKHQLSDAAGTLDALYKFDIGGDAAPVSVTFTGNYNSNNDTFDISANTGTDSTPVWIQIGSIIGVNSTSNTIHTLNMFANMIVSDVAGEVQIRVNNTGLSSSSFDTDQVFVTKSDTSRSVGYSLGQIWVNTNLSNITTESFVDGVADNPVSTLAAAKTLSTNLGLSDFHIINGSTITLAESTDNESYFGDNWSLAQGGQSCDGAHFIGASVTGVATSAVEVQYDGCDFGTASLAIAHCDFCAFAGTITQTTAGPYEYHNCYSKESMPPVFTKTPGQVVNVEFHNYSGDIIINGVEAGDVIELGGVFRTIVVDGTGGTVHTHGGYGAITDNSGGSVTITVTGSAKFGDVAAVLVDTTAIEVDTQDIQSRLPAALSSGNMKSDTLAISTSTAAADNLEVSAGTIVVGAAATGTLSTTVMTTDLTEATDDHYNGRIIIWTSGVLQDQATDITDYSGTNGTLTFTAVTEAPSDSDSFIIV